MLIYMFLVWRMLYIYGQLYVDSQNKTFAQRAASWASRFQTKFIITYFLIANMCNWTCWYCLVYTDPYKELTGAEITIYLIFSILNFVIELSLGITFILLWKFFNNFTKSPQFGISKQ